ncbi:kinase-like domain-containing protein [Mycena filopes]|nr:kinase-like domain-containing protein [Mycena filopes]
MPSFSSSSSPTIFGSIRLFAELLDWGQFVGNDYLVYPLGAMSLDHLLRSRRLMPLSRVDIRAFSWQVAKALQYLHSIGLIHTDIKPANVILVDGRTRFVRRNANCDNSGSYRVLVDTSIKVIDLDDAVHVGPPRRWVIGTGPYRAPELTVSAGSLWSTPVDAFSLGCLVAELFLGHELLVSCKTVEERLASLERCIGLGSTGYGRMAHDRASFFTSTRPRRVFFNAVVCDRWALNRVAAVKDLSAILDWPELLTVCRQLLRLDPASRITVRAALQYPYFASHTSVTVNSGEAKERNDGKLL